MGEDSEWSVKTPVAIDTQELIDNLGVFYLGMNPGYKWVGYQQDRICEHLEALERGDIRRLMVWLPPGHSKSDLGTRHFIPWFMGRNKEKNAMVVSYSAELAAKDFGASIKQKMGSELYKKCFPSAIPTRDSRSNSLLKTVGGGTFYAAGFDGSMSGKRVDLMVIDDPIKNQEEAESEARLTFLVDTYKTVIKTRMRPRGKIALFNTRWAIRDFAARLLDEEGDKWTVLSLPAEDPPDSEHWLWEEFYGADHYHDAKFTKSGEVKDEWYSLWQQDPQASMNFWFKQEWLNYYDVPVPANKYNTYMIVDPAGAKNKKSDYTSVHVWAAGPEQRLFLCDWVHDKLDPGERVETILRLTRRWTPRKILYEEYGMQNDVYYIKQKMRERGFEDHFHPIPIGRTGPRHNLSKHERIKGLIPFYREGHIFLPRKCQRRMWNGRTVDLTQRFIDEELTLYKGDGSIQHEDDLDAMSRLCEPELNIQYFEPQEEEVDQGYGSGNGSWESVY